LRSVYKFQRDDMSSSPAADEEATWRRRLAARANNRAWTLSEQTTRTPEEDREMLQAAHAAMYLWSAIGTPLNIALAQLLLGQVHALLGDARYAMSYAEAAHKYFSANAAEPWQAALSHAIFAAAAHCAGDSGLHERHYSAALALVATLPNAEDRAVFDATMKVVPRPRGRASHESA